MGESKQCTKMLFRCRTITMHVGDVGGGDGSFMSLTVPWCSVQVSEYHKYLEDPPSDQKGTACVYPLVSSQVSFCFRGNKQNSGKTSEAKRLDGFLV